MNKKDLSERDICTKFITPAIVDAGWDIKRRIREELTFTSGRIHVKGNSAARGTPKRADYVLFHKPHIPSASLRCNASEVLEPFGPLAERTLFRKKRTVCLNDLMMIINLVTGRPEN